MIGGWYVFATEKGDNTGRDYVALVAGPFSTYQAADALGPNAVAHVNASGYPNAARLEWGIAEFYCHRLVPGTRNKELWVNPSPIER